MVKRLFCWAYFRWSLLSDGLIIGRNFAFQNGLGLTIKNSLKRYKLNQTKSLWAYIREGLLSEGFLRLRFGRTYLFIYIFFGGGGGGGGLLSEFYGIFSQVLKYHVLKNNVFKILEEYTKRKQEKK